MDQALPLAALAWIVAGGGSVPELNQVGIEQDVAEAAQVLSQLSPGGRRAGWVLFASGPGDRSVQVLGRPTPLMPRDPERAALARLFDPRGGRDATYRRTQLAPDGPATAEGLLQALDQAAGVGGGAGLTVYLSGHGQMGGRPSENWMDLWQESALTPPMIAEVLDRHGASGRPVRFVITTCHSGGFAELAFAGADEARGAAAGERCGLFAAPWDLQASGCDPNPDRATHQGYARHFLPALAGGATLLGAHTTVRIDSPAPDVPTTTSERWLRHAAPKPGRPSAPHALPHEERVIRALSERLGMGRGKAAAALQLLEVSADSLDKRRGEAQAAEDAAWRKASAGVLARWPVLNDPWHPDFAPTLEAERGAIRRHLAADPAVGDWRVAGRALDDVDERLRTLRARSAPIERLARAEENVALAGRLKAKGGGDWQHFVKLLACEDARP